MSISSLMIFWRWEVGWIILLLISLVWYLDLCLLLKHRPIHGRWFLDQFIRELAFTFALVVLFPPPVLAIFSLIILIFVPAIRFYERAFLSPLSFTTIRRQWTEGSEAMSLEFLKAIPDVALRAIFLFIAKLWLLWVSFAYFPVPYVSRLGALCLALPLFAIKVIPAFNEVRRLIRGWASPTHLVPRYGYLLVWLNEYLYLHDDDLLQDALKARELAQDRITPFEGPLSLSGHLVMLQVESLAYAVLNMKFRGFEITPFLNRISMESMLFKLQAIHMNGSCDADFTLLHSHLPGSRVATYRIPNYPHHDSLPRKCNKLGIPLSFLHGQKGVMFNRQELFKTMGFEYVVFGEDMRKSSEIVETKMGGVPDHYVFDLAADLLSKGPERQAVLIVTVSSHAPFHDIPPDFRSVFSGAEGGYRTHYFNSLRYFDEALENLVRRLPRGTIFVIFGDHEPPGIDLAPDRIRSDRSFRSESRTKDFVPGIVYRKGLNSAALQRTPTDMALSGELTMLDLATWIHAWFDPGRAFGGPLYSMEPIIKSSEMLSNQASRAG